MGKVCSLTQFYKIFSFFNGSAYNLFEARIRVFHARCATQVKGRGSKEIFCLIKANDKNYISNAVELVKKHEL